MTLADRIRTISNLDAGQSEYLRTLCSSWQVLADLSFSDLLLYVRRRSGDAFEVAAQLRPFTSQTLYPQDMVGHTVTQPEQPIVERAFREGRIWAQDDPVLVDGIPIRMDAVPVVHRGEVIGVVTKEGSPGTSRRPGRLEQVYLSAAEDVSKMIAQGLFPGREVASGEWPRVGDGLFVLDAEGRVMWASPNALSALSRLGIQHNVLGRWLDDLGVGQTPVEEALASQHIIDGELVRGDTFIRLRVVPMVDEDSVTGGLVLVRDITDVRQKERLISVRDATIREIHHRVKNNLQTIASLLRLQSRRLQSLEAKAALQESEFRIGSIAVVHETLAGTTSDVTEFGEVARRIGRMVGEGLLPPESGVVIKVTGSTGALGADLATPLAVILTELIQNAIEHAFPDGGGGTVAVELGTERDSIVVVVWDDGVGMDDEVLEPKGDAQSRLGLQIVRSLIDELGGTVTVTIDSGTRVELRVPIAGSRLG